MNSRTPPSALLPLTLALLGVLPHLADAQTLPSGMRVVAGGARTSVSGSQLTVTTASNNTILNWNSFSVGSQSSVYFQQPSSSSAVLNRVLGRNASAILGTLGSNGSVWLVNPNGILFGKNARVDVAGLVASTLGITNSDWLSGHFQFNAGSGTTGDLINQGTLRTPDGGRVLLLGVTVSNEGTISTSNGQSALVAGSSVGWVDTHTPNIAVAVPQGGGTVNNSGTVLAAGGTIDLQAAMVNQSGIVRADSLSAGPGGSVLIQASTAANLSSGSVTSANGSTGGQVTIDAGAGIAQIGGNIFATGDTHGGGQIHVLGRSIGVLAGAHIVASGNTGGGSVAIGGGSAGQDASLSDADEVLLAAGSSIEADAVQSGNGGHITVWGGVSDRVYGRLSARGGAQSGNGGLIETSGGWIDVQPSALLVGAAHGSSGTWLLDPTDIYIDDGNSGSAYDTLSSATYTSGLQGNSPSFISSATLASALDAGTNVTLQTSSAATASTTGAGNIYWGGSTYNNFSSSSLALTAAHPGSLTLIADAAINVSQVTVTSSGGAFSLNMLSGRGGSGATTISGSSLSTNGGNISVGGYQTGQLAGGGTFLGASGASNNTSGVFISQSTLNAGGGTVKLSGVTSDPYPGEGALSVSGVYISQSTINAGDIVIQGDGAVAVNGGSSVSSYANGVWIEYGSQLTASGKISISGSATAGDGVDLLYLTPQAESATTLTADHSLSIAGASASGYGVNVGGVDLNVSPTYSDPTASLTIAGSSSSSLPGVNINRETAIADTNIIATNGAGISILASNVSGYQSDSALYIGNAYQGGSAISGQGLIQTLGGGAIKLGTTGTGDAITIDGDLVEGSGPVAILSNNVSLSSSGSSVTTAISSSAGGTAILLAGNADSGGKPLTYLDNEQGASVLSAPNGRWIIYGDTVADLLSPAGTAIADGLQPNTVGAIYTNGLGYNFKRYGASNGAWNGDSGNGLVFAGVVNAPLTGTVSSKIYDGTTAATIGGLSATFQYGDVGTPSGPTVAGKFASAAPGTDIPVTLAAAPYAVRDANGLPVYGYTYVSEFKGNIGSIPGAIEQAGNVGTASGPGNGGNKGGTPGITNNKGGGLVDVSGTPSLPSAAALNDFSPHPIDGMTQGALGTWLAGRDAYLQSLFGDALQLLGQDPTLADLPVCESLKQALSGKCIVTEQLRTRLRAERTAQLKSASGPQSPAAVTLGSSAQTPAQATIQAAEHQRAVELQSRLDHLFESHRVSQSAVPAIRRKVALVLGVSQYQDGSIPGLQNAARDAQAVGATLHQLGYESLALIDPTRQEVVQALNRIALELDPEDSFTLYYAGHGELVSSTQTGYWILSDARHDDPTGWLANNDIARMVNAVAARQIAVVSDSCYSGSLIRGARIRAKPNQHDPSTLLSGRSMVVMSSGGNQPVFDAGRDGHSLFAASLIDNLGGIATWQSGGRVFERVRFDVARSLPQRPQYGSFTDLDRGLDSDYLFERRRYEAGN